MIRLLPREELCLRHSWYVYIWHIVLFAPSPSLRYIDCIHSNKKRDRKEVNGDQSRAWSRERYKNVILVTGDDERITGACAAECLQFLSNTGQHGRISRCGSISKLSKGNGTEQECALKEEE